MEDPNGETPMDRWRSEEGSASRLSGGPRLSEPQRVCHRVAFALETKPFWHEHTLRLRRAAGQPPGKVGTALAGRACESW